MFVDRWRSDQYDPGVVSHNLGMFDNFFDIGLVFGQWYVLLVRSIWERSIVGTEEDDLSIISAHTHPCPGNEESYQEANLSLLGRGHDCRQYLKRLASIIAAKISLELPRVKEDSASPLSPIDYIQSSNIR
jgi:hypothetical protein